MALPDQIPFSEVRSFVERYGMHVDDVISVELGTEAMTVVQLRRTEDGQLIAAGNNCATVTTVVGYDRSA